MNKHLKWTTRCALSVLALSLIVGGCKSREEQLEAERTQGAKLVEDQAAKAKGIGQALQNDGQKAAEEVAAGVGKVFSGVTQGLDRAAEVHIVVDGGAEKLGLKSERAVLEVGSSGSKNALKAYVLASQKFKGTLHVRGLDAHNREVGRSAKVEYALDADDAQYLHFEFDAATPMTRVAKWVLWATAS